MSKLVYIVSAVATVGGAVGGWLFYQARTLDKIHTKEMAAASDPTVVLTPDEKAKSQTALVKATARLTKAQAAYDAAAAAGTIPAKLTDELASAKLEVTKWDF